MRRRVPAAPVPHHNEREPPREHPLAGLSNHALARVLARAPAEISAAEWERSINVGESKIPLYADIATQIGTAGIRDVEGTDEQHIHKALTPTDGEVKPGLNFVSRGLSKGRTLDAVLSAP